MHNETKDLLKATEGRLDLYVTDFSNEWLPNFESLVAAKGVVVAENGEVIKQFNAFKEEHDNVNQELIGIKKLAKDGNLIGYENKYDGQRYDEAHLASFTDDVVAKFCDYKFDDEPAPHPFPISQNPGTEAEMVDIICKEREYIDKICITPALYISFLNYAIRKFDKPYIKYGKFMLFVKDYAFNFPRYINAKKFYKQAAADANQQTGAAAAGVVLPAAVNQSTSALIPPSPALNALPKKASNPKKRKPLPLPTRTGIASKISKSWDTLTDIEKKYAIVLEYTKPTWDTFAFVSTHAISWENLSEDQQEAADYLFGREKWEKIVRKACTTGLYAINKKPTLCKQKTKKQKTKTNQYLQRSPVPEVEEVFTRSGEANRISIVKREHFFIHSVTDDNSWPTGVLLTNYDNKEQKLEYDCPYCTKSGIHPSGFTKHITNCPFNPYCLKK